MPSPELVVLMGAPGAGKSTYARRFCHVVSTDALRELAEVDRGVIGRTYAAAFAAAESSLRAGRSIVLDTTGASPTVRARALRIARDTQAVARLVVLRTPLDTCIERQRGRAAPVPDVDVRRLHAAIEDQLGDVSAEGWAKIEHVVPSDMSRLIRVAAGRPDA